MSLRSGRLLDVHEAMQMNALQLAYLGDSVWELIVRYELIVQKLNVQHMHQNCVKMVNACSQAKILLFLMEILSEQEKEIVRRGRNAHTRHPIPKNQNPDDYAMSTGFEALFGFLYITGQNERICQLIKYIKEVKPNV